MVSHDYVTSVLESLKQPAPESKVPENVYDQAVSDEGPKGEPTYATLSSAGDKNHEKCIGAGESDIRYPANEAPIYEPPMASENEIKPKTNGMTKLVIEENEPKVSTTSAGKLGR